MLASFLYFKGETLLLSNFLPSLMYTTSFVATESFFSVKSLLKDQIMGECIGEADS